MRIIFIISAVVIFIYPDISFSQTPEFNLRVMNFTRPFPNEIEFDIRLEHTNSPVPFEYSGGQYFIEFNPAISNGGILTYSYTSDSSDLPANLRPRNPQVSGSQLRLATNVFPGLGNGFIMTNNGSPGTKIARMKIQTTAASIANVPLEFRWRDQSPDPFTKIYAYVGTVNTNISAGALYYINIYPEFNLRAMNFSFPSSNIMEFEIRLEHTNPPIPLDYSSGQYFFEINTEISNGGILTYTYAMDSSDLPTNLRPRNPQVSGSQLRLAANVFPGAGNGFIMTNNGSPGTKIARMRIQTSSESFLNVPLNFSWRDQSPDPYTKTYAYFWSVNTNISEGATYSVDTSFLPVNIQIKSAIEGLYNSIENYHSKKDSIILILKNSYPPYQTAGVSVSVLDSNTLVSNHTFRFLNSGEFYLVLKYKNALETWSRAGGENIVNGNSLYFDFTDSLSKAYGNNMTLSGSKYCLYSGDIDNSGFIDLSDAAVINNDGYNFLTGEVVTDLNGDRFVDIDDLAIADNNVFNFIGMNRP